MCAQVCVYLCTQGCVLHKRIPLRLALSNFQIVIMPLLAHCGDKMQNVMNYFIITIKSKPLGRVSADVACDLWWLVAVFVLARFRWLSSQGLRRLISTTNDYDTNKMSHLQGFFSLSLYYQTHCCLWFIYKAHSISKAWGVIIPIYSDGKTKPLGGLRALSTTLHG